MKTRKQGFTLIEVILSIMLLGIISISVLPMSIYTVKFAKWNNIRLTALNLAYTQIEWVKSLQYDEIGLYIPGYSPYGNIKPDQYMKTKDMVDEDVIIDGIKYSLTTSIYWQKETSINGEPVAKAIKKIDTSVEAIDLNSGKQKEYAVLGTLVSKEGEGAFSEPGHITVTVNLRSANDPEKNVRVGLGKTKNYSDYTNTEEKGEALFGDLIEGDYFIEPVSWKYNKIVIMPNGVEGTVGSQNWKTNKKVVVPKWDKNKQSSMEYPKESFLVDFPGYIDIVNKNSSINNFTIEIKPTGESYIPNEGDSPSHMTLTNTLKNIGDIKFWRMWNYEYIIKNGEDTFFFLEEEDDKPWDGKFNILNLMDSSYKRLYLSFGLKDANYKLNKNPLKVEEINIEFTSNIVDKTKIRFALNEIEILKESYIITETISNKTNKFKIKFKIPIEVTGDEINFKILNSDEIKDNYDLILAKDKSFILLKEIK